MATEGGVELIVHQARAMIERHPDWVILKSDIKNDFNSISRQHLLQQVCNHFPDVYPRAFNIYGHVSSLVYTKGHSTVILQSQEGVHQGDPLGPSLFPLLYNHYFLRFRSNIPEFKLWPIWMTSLLLVRLKKL